VKEGWPSLSVEPLDNFASQNKHPQKNLNFFWVQFCEVGGLVTAHNINEPNLARCMFSRDIPLGHGRACGHNGQG
jgi:hypothetical protein